MMIIDSLQRLPSEVFAHVAKHLVATGLLATCAALNRSSRLLDYETSPILFKAMVSWTTGGYLDVFHHVGPSHNPGTRPALDQFWRQRRVVMNRWETMHLMPEADHVRCVSLKLFGKA
jgi:hypothetical protein